MHRIRHILRSNNGFTIAEQLVTLIIVGLVTMAVAVGVSIAVNAFRDIRNVTDSNAALSDTVTTITDELRFATGVQAQTIGGATVYSYDSTVRDYRMYLADSTSGITVNSINRTEEVGTTAAGTASTALLPIANTGTTSSDAKYIAHLKSLSYNSATQTWTVDVYVTNGTRTLDSGTFTVKAVNNW